MSIMIPYSFIHWLHHALFENNEKKPSPTQVQTQEKQITQFYSEAVGASKKSEFRFPIQKCEMSYQLPV